MATGRDVPEGYCITLYPILLVRGSRPLFFVLPITVPFLAARLRSALL